MLSLADTTTKLTLSGTILILSIFLWNYLRFPLKSFPGPVATDFTNLWRFIDVLKGRADITLLNLHRRYGAAVRVGPNALSLSDPRVIGVVYNTRRTWQESRVDAMSQLSFGETLGILEAGKDVKKLHACSVQSFKYFAPICQMPILDFFLDKNLIHRLGPPEFDWATAFSVEAYKKRQMEGPRASDGKTDFLDMFIEAKEYYPDIVDDNMIMIYLLSNVIAGSDTTASTMVAAVHYVLKHPSVHRKLREELERANPPLPVSWKAIQDLPYLDAVMKETIRIHPGIGLMLERIVPEGGLTLPDGRFVPEGTVAGMNPWVVNKDEGVFGSEPDRFIPERWLKHDGETEQQFQHRLGKMKGTILSFGAGKRVCMGRALSKLESYQGHCDLVCEIRQKLFIPWLSFMQAFFTTLQECL
ncbi:hypothetical protein VTN00DRAFT_3086 [Thermoascus crustaceus]|uniref:uncharacterized protein n=1 Tax=Thermoascus crustaceus TaxID=5088 RepID=UPI0037435D47